jgi:hypothetical protein
MKVGIGSKNKTKVNAAVKKILYISLALGIVICVSIGAAFVVRGFPKAEKGNASVSESTEFAHKIQAYVSDHMGQPIEGFNAPLYLQAFPGLLTSDFNGVKTEEGIYTYENKTLSFVHTPLGRISTAAESITDDGYATLVGTLRGRLGAQLSIDDIITHMTNDATYDLVSVGDTLGAMKVVRVAPFNSGQYSSDPKMTKIGPENIRIILHGPIEVTGTYKAVHSEIGFDAYCMSVSDHDSLSRLPPLPVRAGAPNMRGYFCFRNTDFVQKKLGEETRTVTVTIDNYELNSYPSEVVDYADLVQ